MSEIEYLERVIQDPEGVKTDEIADFLGRTSSSVSTQIGRLKTEKFPEELGKRFNGWKQSEINFLKGAAGKIPYTEIAQELNKTVAAVYHKARDLGIKISNPAIQYSEIKKYATGEYTAKEIASKLGTSYSAEQVRKYRWRHPELKIKNTQELARQKMKEREWEKCQYYKKISSNSRT